MPEDVRFGLPFDTPVSEHLECARSRHPRWIRDMGLGRATSDGPRVLPDQHS